MPLARGASLATSLLHEKKYAGPFTVSLPFWLRYYLHLQSSNPSGNGVKPLMVSFENSESGTLIPLINLVAINHGSGIASALFHRLVPNRFTATTPDCRVCCYNPGSGTSENWNRLRRVLSNSGGQICKPLARLPEPVDFFLFKNPGPIVKLRLWFPAPQGLCRSLAQRLVSQSPAHGFQLFFAAGLSDTVCVALSQTLLTGPLTSNLPKRAPHYQFAVLHTGPVAAGQNVPAN